MFTPIAAISSHEIIITGQGSLLQRPVDFFDAIFPSLKIDIKSNNGLLPLKIKGPLQPVNITIDGSLSSQFLTGLLFAFAHTCTTPVSIKVNNLKSKPYIDLTLQVMKHFGWKIENSDYTEFKFEPKSHSSLISQPTIIYKVEGDWSNAAFLFVAGAIAGKVTVKGMDIDSSQGDKAILKVLEMAGAKVEINDDEITVANNVLQSFEFDANDCPDLFPPLVALSAYCKGVSKIKGVGRLTHKESNRAVTLQNEFGKMGVKIFFREDIMFIEGGKVIKGTIVDSNNDHRIAMACAIAALQANAPMEIHHAEAVKKSYPDFYNHLTMLQKGLQKT
jgi:3-phosphoshikimate 1-carboxyvinyltransferase